MVNLRPCIRYAVVIAVMGGLWKLTAIAMGGIILPYPEDAVTAFVSAAGTRLFWEHFGVSAYRAVAP